MTSCVMPYMLVISLIGLVKTRARYDRVISWIMFFLLCALFGIYVTQNADRQFSGFSILWGYSQFGDIMLDYKPTYISNEVIIPLFFLNLLVAFNYNSIRYEERQSSLTSFVFLNFISIMLLVCAENYVQLITMVFISDIMGYMILKNVDSSRRYVIYNFFADMCLFTILSLACGKIQSLDISMLLGYDQIGRHKDFVSLVTLLALFVKIGCFPFQTYLTDLTKVKFQRMIIVNLLSSPLVGIMLLIKLHNLLLISDMFTPIFQTIIILTLLTGFVGFITKSYMQKKIIYLNMFFFGLLLKAIQINDFNWSNLIALYYIAIYLFNILFFKTYICINKETNMTKILNIKELNLPVLKALLLQISWLSGLTLVLALEISKKSGTYTFFCGILIAILAISIVLNYLYVYSKKEKINIRSTTQKSDISSILLFGLLAYGTYMYQTKNFAELIIFITAFLIMTAIWQGKYLQKIYDQNVIQKTDLSKTFFSRVIAFPLMRMSRILGLMIDFFLSEKVITASISTMEKIGTKMVLLINKKSKWSPLILILIGILLFLLTYYEKGGHS